MPIYINLQINPAPFPVETDGFQAQRGACRTAGLSSFVLVSVLLYTHLVWMPVAESMPHPSSRLLGFTAPAPVFVWGPVALKEVWLPG